MLPPSGAVNVKPGEVGTVARSKGLLVSVITVDDEPARGVIWLAGRPGRENRAGEVPENRRRLLPGVRRDE